LLSDKQNQFHEWINHFLGRNKIYQFLTLINNLMKTINLLFAIILLIGISCGDKKGPKKNVMEQQMEAQKASAELEAQIGERARSTFQVLATKSENPNNPMTEAKIKLGKILYFDTRLSKDGTQSCNTCHDLNTFGVDNEPTSPGDDGGLGTRNSPTVLNAALHTSQFWDGRAKDVEEQAGMPILNPVEMAIPNEKFLVDRLSKVALYKDLFKQAYPNESKPLTYVNLQNAIAAFERILLTPSKFDQYLQGNANALSLDEKKGLKTFMEVGCTTCHMGSLLGGNIFQKFGVYSDYWALTGSDPVDEGRFTETGNEADKYMFKVPSLRNITETHPYFHDGSVESLEEAIKIIAKLKLNIDLTDEQSKDLVTFLSTLTSDLPAEVKQMPEELVSSL
jgi:cytochrome c peroxidase